MIYCWEDNSKSKLSKDVSKPSSSFDNKTQNKINELHNTISNQQKTIENLVQNLSECRANQNVLGKQLSTVQNNYNQFTNTVSSMKLHLEKQNNAITELENNQNGQKQFANSSTDAISQNKLNELYNTVAEYQKTIANLTHNVSNGDEKRIELTKQLTDVQDHYNRLVKYVTSMNLHIEKQNSAINEFERKYNLQSDLNIALERRVRQLEFEHEPCKMNIRNNVINIKDDKRDVSTQTDTNYNNIKPSPVVTEKPVPVIVTIADESSTSPSGDAMYEPISPYTPKQNPVLTVVTPKSITPDITSDTPKEPEREPTRNLHQRRKGLLIHDRELDNFDDKKFPRQFDMACYKTNKLAYLMKYLKQLDKRIDVEKPECILIHVGGNDITNSTDNQSTLRNYKDLLYHLIDKCDTSVNICISLVIPPRDNGSLANRIRYINSETWNMVSDLRYKYPELKKRLFTYNNDYISGQKVHQHDGYSGSLTERGTSILWQHVTDGIKKGTKTPTAVHDRK